MFSTSETLLLLDEDRVAPYPRLNGDQMALTPGYRIFPVSDGWVAVAALGAEQEAALRQVAEVESGASVPGALATRKIADVVDMLARAGIASERVRQCHWFNCLDDAELRSMELTVGYEHARYGWTEQPGAFWTFPGLRLHLDRSGPVLGQHTREVLAEVGYAPSEIEALHVAGIVASP